MTRVVLLTSLSQGLASRCLPELAGAKGVEVVSVVLVEGPGASGVKSLKRQLRKVRKIGLLGALNGVRIRQWFHYADAEPVEAVCERLGIPLHRTDQTNSPETARLIRSANADLGVSLGNSYIAERIFTIPRLGMINVHTERLPEYQNAQSIIWPIYNLETVTGLTIHEVSAQMDAGRILYQELYPIRFRDNLQETVRTSLQYTFSRVGPCVRFVCENFERLTSEATEQSGGSSYTTPSIWAFIRMIRNNRTLYRRLRAAV